MRSSRRAAHGFTLVELLIVVVVLGILASVVVSNYVDFTHESRESVCRADFRTLTQGVEAYEAKEGGPAADEDALIGPSPGGETYIKEASEFWDVDNGDVVDLDGDPGNPDDDC